MVLDNQKQQKLLLEIISMARFTGSCIESLYWLKQDILKAEIATKPEKIKKNKIDFFN